MKRDLVKLVGGVLLGGVAMFLVLPACGGSTEGSGPVPTVPAVTATAQQPAPTAAPAPTPTAAPAPTPTAGASQPASPAASGDSLAEGKRIFEKTAGGVGCAYCHGLDGKSQGTAGVGAPPNRGATEAQVREALLRVPMMSFIKLNDAEIKALAAYLQYLDKQP